MWLKEIFESMNKLEKTWKPKLFWTKEELQDLIVDYFENWADKKDMYSNWLKYEIKLLTITWLTLHLWFANKNALYAYEKDWEFKDTIKMARTFIEREYEMQLQTWSATWAIFALKNFGWKDIQTLEWSIDDNWEKKFVIERVVSKYENLDENWEEIKEEWEKE